MAKRKSAGGSRASKAGKKSSKAAKSARRGTRKAAARKRSAARAASKKTATKAARPAARKTAKKPAAPRRATARTAQAKTARKSSAARKPAARRTTTSRGAAQKTGSTRSTSSTPPPRPRPARALGVAPSGRASQPRAATPRQRSTDTITRKAPALNRARRTVQDDDLVPTPPSTLDMDRTASAVRTGRRELRERFDEHTETGPALTGGDIDADWESAYSVGDEAPGGDSPTPDQDIVDDIGRAVGVQYQDNEELKGDEKIAQRDRHRWELDPASSEDYEDR